MLSKKDHIRIQAENDLETFIKIVAPNRVLGNCHRDLIDWWERPSAGTHQLALMPRDHQKSAIVGFRAAQAIARNPAIKILYLSSTANLAEKQLKFIKDILELPVFSFYWPEMLHRDEGRREKWTTSEISVDHPKRREEAIRDPTIFTGGLTTTLTGLHCDIAILDDVVVYENAYTEEGRNKVEGQYSLLASIEGSDSQEWIVGTRYHPKDLYAVLGAKEIYHYNDLGEELDSEQLYEVFERQVENSPFRDGSGDFLWPRQQRADGRWFGFDRSILEKKRSQYLDKVQFFAQYYNDPNVADGEAISRDAFQYYDTKHLNRQNGNWYFKSSRLNVFAAVDFAFSLKKNADFTCVTVVGVDHNQNYYILEIDRFKTEDISEYFKHILRLYQKWDFRKLRAEVTAGQKPIVKDLKQNYIRKFGLSLVVDEFLPTRSLGNKEERTMASLQARYQNKQIWHYMGGFCETLEDELTAAKPLHDDVKDCLAACIDICVAPTIHRETQQMKLPDNVHTRFGGIA